MAPKRSKFLTMLICLVAVMGWVFIKYGEPDNKSHTQLLKEYTKTVLGQCKNSTYPPDCYDKQIPHLMDPPSNVSMEEAFEITRIIQKSDPRYLYCHVLGHNVSAKEERKDPSKWKDIITRCPTTMCNNGCLHGTIMARYQSETLTDPQIEKLIPDLKTVCEPRGSWRPLGIERGMCIHALGHLLMYTTDANLRKSSEVCKKINRYPGDSLNCTQGVFMSLYQPLEPEDFALVKDKTPKREDVARFCSRFNDNRNAWSACLRESWPLFYSELMKPEGTVTFCSYSDDPNEKSLCYNHVLHQLTIAFLIRADNINTLVDFCTAIPKPFDSVCFASAARRLLQIDPQLEKKAINVCKSPRDVTVQNQCFKQFIGSSPAFFRTKSKEALNFCSLLPPQWKDACVKAQQTPFTYGQKRNFYVGPLTSPLQQTPTVSTKP